MPFRRPEAHDLDALRAQAHRVLHRALHRAAEHDPLLELLGDRVGNQLRVDLGLADLLDVEADVAAHHLAQVAAQRLDVLALLADHDAGARAVDRDPRVLRRALDRDLAYRRVPELLLQVLAHLDVLGEHRREILAVRVPARRPVALTARRKPVGWISVPWVPTPSVCLQSPTVTCDVAGRLADAVAAALGARGETLQRVGLVDVDRLDLQLVDVGAVVVLGVGDRRLEHLLDDLGALLRAERENAQRAVDRQPADLVGDEPALLGRQAHAAQRCCGFHRRFHRLRRRRPVLRFLTTFLSAAWPLNVRVSANSPSLWPTMFSDT